MRKVLNRIYRYLHDVVSGPKQRIYPMFLRLQHKLNTFLQLPWADRWLFARAYCWLGVARLAILTVPFRWLAPFLGTANLASDHAPLEPDTKMLVQRVAWAVRTAGHHTPWTSNCLPQAIVAKRLLDQQHVPSTLYLGLSYTQEDQRELLAHAWLRSGKFHVVGGRGEQHFTVVATFA